MQFSIFWYRLLFPDTKKNIPSLVNRNSTQMVTSAYSSTRARAHTHPHTPKHPYLHVDSGPFLSDLHHTGEETRRKTKTPPGSWPTSSDSPLTVMSRLTWKWVLVDAVQETTCYTSQSDSFLCGSEMLRSLNRSGWITHVLGFLTFNSITLLSGKQISLRRQSQLSFFIITFFS